LTLSLILPLSTNSEFDKDIPLKKENITAKGKLFINMLKSGMVYAKHDIKITNI
jgi:hypothetical protein